VSEQRIRGKKKHPERCDSCLTLWRPGSLNLKGNQLASGNRTGRIRKKSLPRVISRKKKETDRMAGRPDIGARNRGKIASPGGKFLDSVYIHL
jgi:hypothetical protein